MSNIECQFKKESSWFELKVTCHFSGLKWFTGVLLIAAIIWMPVIDWFFKNRLCYVKTAGVMFLLTIIK